MFCLGRLRGAQVLQSHFQLQCGYMLSLLPDPHQSLPEKTTCLREVWRRIKRNSRANKHGGKDGKISQGYRWDEETTVKGDATDTKKEHVTTDCIVRVRQKQTARDTSEDGRGKSKYIMCLQYTLFLKQQYSDVTVAKEISGYWYIAGALLLWLGSGNKDKPLSNTSVCCTSEYCGSRTLEFGENGANKTTWIIKSWKKPGRELEEVVMLPNFPGSKQHCRESEKVKPSALLHVVAEAGNTICKTYQN